MTRLKCYQNLEGCSNTEYRQGIIGYERNWNINFLIQPPAACRTIEIYRWLKEYCGFNKLMIPSNTLELYNARDAGWRPEELVIWWSKGLTTDQMDTFERDRISIFGTESHDFYAWYLDEPQNDDMEPSDVRPLYEHWKKKKYGQHFIVGDWG